MRRKGVILLDGLMALFLISALAVMVLPLAGSWLSALDRDKTFGNGALCHGFHGGENQK